MKNLDYREYYRRNLPHIQPGGASFLVNFRLAGSLPKEVLEKLRAEAEELERKIGEIKEPDKQLVLREKKQGILFGKWDDAIHRSCTGYFWLKEDRIAEIVAGSIQYRDGEWFDLQAYCIMPNHCHIVLRPLRKAGNDDHGLTQITHNIKRNSAFQANAILGRSGTFWQHESYDHYARNEVELQRIIKYVLQNPVKAGLVTNWQDWKWTYCKYNL